MSFFPPRFHPNATLHLIVLSHHVIAFQHFLFLMTFTILRRSGEAFVEQSSTGSHPVCHVIRVKLLILRVHVINLTYNHWH